MPAGDHYVKAARSFADAVLAHGRDTYGKAKTPLFVDGLHAKTLQPVRWLCRGETWVLCNVASQQPLLRLLDGLTALTGDASTFRRRAACSTGAATWRGTSSRTRRSASTATSTS